MTLGQLQQEVLELTSEERERFVEWMMAGLALEAELEREWLEGLRGAGRDQVEVDRDGDV
jgi:hypothetical protein